MKKETVKSSPKRPAPTPSIEGDAEVFLEIVVRVALKEGVGVLEDMRLPHGERGVPLDTDHARVLAQEVELVVDGVEEGVDVGLGVRPVLGVRQMLGELSVPLLQSGMAVGERRRDGIKDLENPPPHTCSPGMAGEE